LRRDLRLADHQALTDAARLGAVVPVYIHAPHEDGAWAPGAASNWWLHQSLRELSQALAARGSRLVLRRGNSLEELRRLLAESGAQRIVWQRLYEPALTARDATIKSALRADGVAADSFPGALLFEPWEALNKSQTPYQVFTPFWRAALARLRPADTLPAPRYLAPPQRWPRGVALDDLQLMPRTLWHSGLQQAWQPGEAGAAKALKRFAGGPLGDYATERDLPARRATSLLSPALHFGEVSPRQVLRAVSSKAGWREHRFVAQIGWREFAHALLFHFPHTTDAPLRPEFAQFQWRDARATGAQLRAWQQGRTGIPVIDAGMRELWATGYMHNRVRMLVASFLVKNLRIHWLEGARWFWDTLVDADLANNTLGWQWSAGCGADAAPYFRVFNPHVQARRFDPAREYIRRWVPEVDTPAYPPPIVDLDQTRREALAEWRAMRARMTTT
jgi:deoxyribodipyrimidine photo-lyase